MATESIGAAFERRPNALNSLRMLLAIEVLVWHSWSLMGRHLPDRLQHFVSDVGVDAFFLISGFLICRAWMRRPALRPFLAARARRLMPGLITCLVVTAFAIVPIACLAASRPVPSPGALAEYVASNAFVHVGQWSIGSTLDGLAHQAWNGSLWSLSWEVYCYLAIAILGVLGVLSARPLAAIVLVAWSWSVVLEILGTSPYDSAEILWMPQRAALCFGIGALGWLWRDRVPRGRSVLLISVLTLVTSIAVFDNYRIAGAVALGYCCIHVSTTTRLRRVSQRHSDLSYGVYIYGFPVQQALLLAGTGAFGWPVYLLVSLCTALALAWASWTFVERRFMHRGRRTQHDPDRSTGVTTASAVAQPAAAATHRWSAAAAAPESTASAARA